MDTAEAMEKENEPANRENEFYVNAQKYWDNVPATVNGMLGGFGFISKIDVKGSTLFLRSIFESQDSPMREYALDCGAGIGRVTANLLSRFFRNVDLVEQNPKFLETAERNLQSLSEHTFRYFPIGLQNFDPEVDKYDVIWCQWVLGHLKDDDLIEFLKKCKKALRKNGVLVIKENVTSSNQLEIDGKDSSVTRSMTALRTIFHDSDLTIVQEEQQTRFPRGLYPVFMFALKPT